MSLAIEDAIKAIQDQIFHLMQIQQTLKSELSGVKNLVEKYDANRQVFEKIVTKVANIAGVYPNQIMGPQKYAEIVWARQLAMYFCRKTTGESFEKLARFFNKKAYGTIVHACDSVESRIETSEKDRQLFEKIRLAIYDGE